MGRRRSSGTYTTTADIETDIADVLVELTDDELRDECRERGILVDRDAAAAREDWRDFAESLRASRGDPLHFEVMVVRMLAMAGVPSLKIPSRALVSE